MSALLVEMLGLPGAGKSALSREVCLVLRERGVPAGIADARVSAAVPRARRVRRRTAAAARSAVRRPGWTLSSAASIASMRQPAGRDTASVLAQWLAVCDLAARARARPGVHLLEEGPLQTLWTLGLRSPDALPHRLLEAWPRAAAPDVVVLLDVPLAVVEERLMRRSSKHSRSQQLPPDLLRAELHRGQKLLEVLAAPTATPVVRLSGDDETTAAGLAGLLADVLSPCPRTPDPTR